MYQGLILFCVITYLALPEVTVADIDTAIPGENVTLNCSAATGNTPFTYQWTMQGISDILNNDTSSGVLVLTDIVLTDFGTYICNVSNIFGSSTSDINLEQGGKPTCILCFACNSTVYREMTQAPYCLRFPFYQALKGITYSVFVSSTQLLQI